MIPTFEKFLYPFLLLLKDGEKTTSQMVNGIADYFNLSEEDRQLLTKGGKSTQLRDRVGWARQYFRRALFIDNPKIGVYKLKTRGLEFLNTHTDLTIDDLLQYEEFAAFYGSSHKKIETGDKKETVKEEPQTPTVQIAEAFHIIEKDIAAELIAKILEKNDPNFFERLVLDLMVNMGYGSAENAQLTKKTGDGGIDGIINQDQLGLEKIYLQAKQWKPTNAVTRPNIQQFAGALVGPTSHKGVFITTSYFTKEAREYVKLNPNIVLIDGEELARLMIKYNVGVQPEKTYVLKKVDLDYFED